MAAFMSLMAWMQLFFGGIYSSERILADVSPRLIACSGFSCRASYYAAFCIISFLNKAHNPMLPGSAIQLFNCIN